MEKIADICLFLEGTYPYTTGGVSTWTYELLQAHSNHTFHLVCLLPPQFKAKPCYEIPSNVLSLTDVRLQRLPKKRRSLTHHQLETLFRDLERPLLNLQRGATLDDISTVLSLLKDKKEFLDRDTLFNSEASWRMVVRMYNTLLAENSFINFFWSWRNLLGSFYSIMLADLPEARLYHTFCTGFAGLFLARAHLETGRPCITTEHGIYASERKIEIASARWLESNQSMNLSIDINRFAFDLKEYWIQTFASYSKLCYSASDQIITLYEGNRELQEADGAAPEKLRIIPNGIDYDLYSKVERKKEGAPTVALIGRVVPIKDVKTFIRSINRLKDRLPNVKAYIIGPQDEDKEYYHECQALVNACFLGDTVIFTGKVDVDQYLSKLDVIVLTSISEAQPLVILEAGASGIPCVATNVGACRELLLGSSSELPPLGAGGIICPLANPQAISDSLYLLLSNNKEYNRYSRAIQRRVSAYYRKEMQHAAYEALYESFLALEKQEEKSRAVL